MYQTMGNREIEMRCMAKYQTQIYISNDRHYDRSKTGIKSTFEPIGFPPNISDGGRALYPCNWCSKCSAGYQGGGIIAQHNLIYHSGHEIHRYTQYC